MKTLTIAVLALLALCTTPAPQQLAPCATEDSTGCYWDASHRGNMQGQSFYTTDAGVTVYLP